jgi:glycerol kinase
MIDVVASIDQGTQSTRVFIFDKDARPLASYQEQLPQIYPQAGCARENSCMVPDACPRHSARRLSTQWGETTMVMVGWWWALQVVRA